MGMQGMGGERKKRLGYGFWIVHTIIGGDMPLWVQDGSFVIICDPSDR